MPEGDWAHFEMWVPRVDGTKVQCLVMHWSSVCVLSGAGQGARPDGNGINYPVNRFPSRETWVGASAAVGAVTAYVRPGHDSAGFCLPCTLGQWSARWVQGGPVVGLAPLEAAGFGGREEGLAI